MDSQILQKQRLYLHVLRDRLGLEAEPHNECCIAFRFAGLQAVVDLSANGSPEYLHIVLLFATPKGLAHARLLEAVNAVNTCMPLVNATVREEALTVHLEGLVSGAGSLPSVEHLAAVLPSFLMAGVAGADRLQEELTLAGILEAGAA
jgi:hypothetical protein